MSGQLSIFTKVVPELGLTLPGGTFNTIYWNSNKMHVFCSSSSFRQTPLDVCISNRSRVTAGFVKTVAHNSFREWEVQEEMEKMRGAFNIWKHGDCKRKDVCFIYAKKKYKARECVEIICISRRCHHHINKKMVVSTIPWAAHSQDFGNSILSIYYRYLIPRIIHLELLHVKFCLLKKTGNRQVK